MCARLRKSPWVGKEGRNLWHTGLLQPRGLQAEMKEMACEAARVVWESHGFCEKSDLGKRRFLLNQRLSVTADAQRRDLLSLQATRANCLLVQKRTLIQISSSRNLVPGLDKLTNLSLFFKWVFKIPKHFFWEVCVQGTHTVFMHVQRSIQTPIFNKMNSPKGVLTELRLLFIGSQI